MPNHQPSLSVQQRCDATVLRHDYRRPTSSGFGCRVAKVLILRRQNEYVSIAIRRPFLIAEEPTANRSLLPDSGFLCSGSHSVHPARLVWPWESQANGSSMFFFGELRERLQQQLRAFFR